MTVYTDSPELADELRARGVEVKLVEYSQRH